MTGRGWIAFVVLALCLSAASGQESKTLIVFAAASLADAFEEIAAGFEAEHPGVDVLFSFGGSSELAAQLREGAPADVFASANARQMAAVQEGGRIGSQPAVFARNRLVLIAPSDNSGQIAGIADLARPGIALVVAAEGVPVRDYTESMLSALEADPAFGPAYTEALRANIVSEEPNVRQVAAKVALGEADAGIVYASDVTPDLNEDVQVFAIPDAVNTIAEYPIAAISDSAEPDLAQAFIDRVLRPAGQAALERWGFIRAVPHRTCFAFGLIFPLCFG